MTIPLIILLIVLLIYGVSLLIAYLTARIFDRYGGMTWTALGYVFVGGLLLWACCITPVRPYEVPVMNPIIIADLNTGQPLYVDQDRDGYKGNRTVLTPVASKNVRIYKQMRTSLFGLGETFMAYRMEYLPEPKDPSFISQEGNIITTDLLYRK